MVYIPVNGIMIYLFILASTFLSCNDINKRDPSHIYSVVQNGIEAKWELPGILKEVSGIAYMDDKRIACIQDEKGSIFVYNLERSEIEKELEFGSDGDYEGLALAGNNAYVLRSDGVLFCIKDFQRNPSVQEYSLGFPASQNMEGLAYDFSHDRLLILGKGNDPAFSDRKGIYSFNLKTNRRDKEPIATIDLADQIFFSNEEKKKHKGSNIFQPSDIGINPVTKEFYILSRTKKQLLILTPTVSIKKLVKLDADLLYAPEGIDFSKTGEIFVSNEFGKDRPASIVKFSKDYFDN